MQLLVKIKGQTAIGEVIRLLIVWL